MIIILWIAAKYCVYAGVCFLATRMLQLGGGRPAAFAFKWGTARLLIGFAAAFFVFVAFLKVSQAGVSEPIAYVLVFVPVRYLEWTIVFALMTQRRVPLLARAPQFWVFAGVAASVIMDQVAFALRLHEIKFFC